MARRRDDDDAELVASGVLRITPRAFLALLATVRHSAPSPAAGALVLARFGLAFLRQLVAVYGRPPRS